MTADQQWRIVDSLQHRLGALEARVNTLVAEMNQFTAEAQQQLVKLLQQQGHEIEIKPKENTQQ